MGWRTKEGSGSDLERFVQEQRRKVFDRLVGEGWGDYATQSAVVLALRGDDSGTE